MGVPEARPLQGKPFVGQAGRGFGWQVVCGDREAQESASERLVGPKCPWEGRSVMLRDLWGKPALGMACGGGARSLWSTVGCGSGGRPKTEGSRITSPALRTQRTNAGSGVHVVCGAGWGPLRTAVPGEVWRDSVSHRSDSPYNSSSGSREPQEGLRGGRSPVQREFLQTPDCPRMPQQLGKAWGPLCAPRH